VELDFEPQDQAQRVHDIEANVGRVEEATVDADKGGQLFAEADRVLSGTWVHGQGAQMWEEVVMSRL